jgi:hypothetical protein
MQQPGAAPQPAAPKLPKGAVIGIAVVVGLVVLGGIGKMVADKVAGYATRAAIEKATGVKVDEKGDVTSIKTDEGTVQVKQDGEGSGTMTFTGEDGETAQFEFSEGGNAKLPAGFPSDFPVMAGAAATASWAAKDGDTTAYTVAWNLPGTVADAKAYYQAELVKAGWRITATTEAEGSVAFVIERGPEDAADKDGGWLSLTSEDGSTKAALTLGIRAVK